MEKTEAGPDGADGRAEKQHQFPFSPQWKGRIEGDPTGHYPIFVEGSETDENSGSIRVRKKLKGDATILTSCSGGSSSRDCINTVE